MGSIPETSLLKTFCNTFLAPKRFSSITAISIISSTPKQLVKQRGGRRLSFTAAAPVNISSPVGKNPLSPNKSVLCLRREVNNL